MCEPQFIRKSTTFGAIAFLGALLLAPAAEADPQAARSRSSASSSSARASAPSGTSSRSHASAPRSSSSRSSPRGAAVTRSTGRHPSAGPRTRVSGTSTHRPGGSGHRHTYGRPYYGSHYGHYYGYPHYYGYYPYSSWGWSFGLGWWGGYFYGPYLGHHYSPYYYSPYRGAYGRAPETVRARVEAVGAFDLNVKPKRTEVWVDGHYVGTTGRFDGFPDYLWLTEGKHQLVFYLDGHVTVERQVETLAGVVADLRIEMEPGRSIPPRQLAIKPPAAPPPASPKLPSVGETAANPSGSLDPRPEPGRLVLSVEPEDASVYLDGRYLGTGRDLARLHAGLLIASGDHRLEIVRPGFEDRAVEFSIEAGEEERIEVGLESG